MWTFWKHNRLINHIPKLKKNRHLIERVIIIVVVIVSLYCLILHTPARTTTTLKNWNTRARVSNENEVEFSPQPDYFNCFDKYNNYHIGQRGQYYVLYNYVRARRWFACHESITYTTIADLAFLDNIKTLIEHWNGPISIALYAPGTDFEHALSIIRYLRICESPLISEYITFHIFFETQHMPQEIPAPATLRGEAVNCVGPPPWLNLLESSSYKAEKKLQFPINVGRNIARDAATTHFVLASDIELYPSINFISDFLEFLRRTEVVLRSSKPQVFVLPPFEIKQGYSPPKTKQELVQMLQNKTAVEFHKKVCNKCHSIPRIQDWKKANVTKGLRIFHTTKKTGMWEPFYVGTNAEPFFDERLVWEGMCDRLTQAYAMCVLDYNYHILDNAFLVHKPGIKVPSKNLIRQRAFGKTVWLIRSKIKNEVHKLYGTNENCSAKMYGR